MSCHTVAHPAFLVLIVDFRRLYREVTFTKVGADVNLSRASPLEVCPSGGNRPFVATVGDYSSPQPAMCWSVGQLVGCHIIHPKPPIGNQREATRQVEVRLIEGEFERLVCCVGHVFHAEMLGLPIHDGALQFGTTTFYTNRSNGENLFGCFPHASADVYCY